METGSQTENGWLKCLFVKVLHTFTQDKRRENDDIGEFRHSK